MDQTAPFFSEDERAAVDEAVRKTAAAAQGETFRVLVNGEEYDAAALLAALWNRAGSPSVRALFSALPTMTRERARQLLAACSRRRYGDFEGPDFRFDYVLGRPVKVHANAERVIEQHSQDLYERDAGEGAFARACAAARAVQEPSGHTPIPDLSLTKLVGLARDILTGRAVVAHSFSCVEHARHMFPGLGEKFLDEGYSLADLGTIYASAEDVGQVNGKAVFRTYGLLSKRDWARMVPFLERECARQDASLLEFEKELIAEIAGQRKSEP